MCASVFLKEFSIDIPTTTFAFPQSAGTMPAESTVYELDLGLGSAWAERTDLALPAPALRHGAVVY